MDGGWHFQSWSRQLVSSCYCCSSISIPFLFYKMVSKNGYNGLSPSYGAAFSIGSNVGFSVWSKDTTTKEGAGFEPPTNQAWVIAKEQRLGHQTESVAHVVHHKEETGRLMEYQRFWRFEKSEGNTGRQNTTPQCSRWRTQWKWSAIGFHSCY